MNRVPVARIKAELQARVLELCAELGLAGRPKGGVLTPINPTRSDRHPGSFVIWTSGGAIGAWHEYSAPVAQGDIIDLIAYVRSWSRGDTIAWAARWTGLDRSGPDITPAVRRRRVDPSAAEEAERQRREKASKRAKALYLSGGGLTGTLGERYLAGRGIDLRALPRQPGALRFHPRLEWVPGRIMGEDGRVVRDGPTYPAILAAMQDPDGKLVACHRTYIANDGTAKAPVNSSRMIYGPAKGGVIAVWRGQSDLPVKEASQHGIADHLVLTEGVEDALAVALAAPECRVWAAASLGNLGRVVLPACAHEVTVFADNDWKNPAAVAELERAIAALAAQGRPVRVARAALGKDANDLLNARLMEAHHDA